MTPDAVGALVRGLVADVWPLDEATRPAFFARHGLTVEGRPVPLLDAALPGTSHYAGGDLAWHFVGDEFAGLALTLWVDDPELLRNAGTLRLILNDAFGLSAERMDDFGVTSSWLVDGRAISLSVAPGFESVPASASVSIDDAWAARGVGGV